MAGALTGTSHLTAVDATFTATVTDSAQDSTSWSYTVPVTLAITTMSPLPAGQVGVNYSQAMTAIGGKGVYTWALSAGSTVPGGLSLNATTGLISGPPAAAATSNFSIQATDSNKVTASQTFALNINLAASLQTLSPNTSNVGLSLPMSITGANTHFVQGTTVASLGQA
jgi:large repetitive protein